jgi:hypothetical protein
MARVALRELKASIVHVGIAISAHRMINSSWARRVL